MPGILEVLPRVFETSVTVGVGTYALDGAQTGHQAYNNLTAGNYTTYLATDDINWEEGIGTVLTGPNRLTRDTILGSSNAGAAVNWGAGTRKIYLSVPAAGIMRQRRLSKSVAGGVAVVLTADEQRRPVLEFTGLLTANIAVEVDATPWQWVVYNNTTGAYTITLKVTGQVGVGVAQGKRKFCYCDGNDVFAADDASEFIAGTRMTFNQTSAPTGWTKETGAAYNNAALRIVTGTAGTGGADAFTTVFTGSRSTAGYTLATADAPAHQHTQTANDAGSDHQQTGSGPSAGTGYATATQSGASILTRSTGGGGAHAHTISSMNLAYVDVIVAQKD